MKLLSFGANSIYNLIKIYFTHFPALFLFILVTTFVIFN